MTASIVLPCYNPVKGWEKRVAEGYHSFCSKIDEKPEVVIVFDGIGKNIGEKEQTYLKEHIIDLLFISYPVNMGKGYAIREGMDIASGDILLYTDIDIPYSVESMLKLYNGLKGNICDVAIGVKDGNYYAHVPLIRRVISYFLRFLTRTFLSMPVTDTQCGLKGFRSFVKPLFMATTINRYLFDLEFIRNCYRSEKYRIQPIPVTLNENTQFNKMNYRILLPEMFNFVKLLFKK